ncbi:MAG: T9SS type A sorting domain-containing protein [Dyadobacter sp.]
MKTKSTIPRHSFFAFSLFLLLTICFQSSYAQKASVSSGGDATGSGGSVSYSIGQVFYNTNSAAGGVVRQGVQQTVNNSPLPVTLVSFEVSPITVENSQQILIHWETTSETNNDFFTIERSANGKTFAELSRVNVLGNSNALKKYSITDPLPNKGISYYRLKQTDLDGTFSYSKIRSVRIDNLSNTIAYPNPVIGYLHVTAIKSETRSYKIFDLDGRLVEENKLAEGESKINMSRLSPATYVVQIVGKSEIKQFKIIKN